MLALMAAGTVAVLLFWRRITADKATYVLTIQNDGKEAVSGGQLVGDGKERLIGGIAPGTSRTFHFGGMGGVEYRLTLNRPNHRQVVSELGWMPSDWDLTLRDRIVVPNDTCRLVLTDVKLRALARGQSESKP